MDSINSKRALNDEETPYSNSVVKGLDLELLKRTTRKLALEREENEKDIEACLYAQRLESEQQDVRTENPMVAYLLELINLDNRLKKTKFFSQINLPGSAIFSYDFSSVKTPQTLTEAKKQCLPTLIRYNRKTLSSNKLQNVESEFLVNKIINLFCETRKRKVSSSKQLSFKRKRHPQPASLSPPSTNGDIKQPDNISVVDPEDDIFPTALDTA